MNIGLEFGSHPLNKEWYKQRKQQDLRKNYLVKILIKNAQIISNDVISRENIWNSWNFCKLVQIFVVVEEKPFFAISPVGSTWKQNVQKISFKKNP